MNRGQLVTAALTRAGVDYAATAAADVVNEALQSLSTEERWPWLQGTAWSFTTADGGPYTPPAGWRDIHAVTVAGSLYSHIHIEDIDMSPDMTGWAVYGDKLVISPAPAAGVAVVVRIDRDESHLDTDADEPLLPVKWQYAVVVLSAAIMFERLDDADKHRLRRTPGRSAALRKDYEATVRRMRRDIRKGRGAIAARVRPGAGI